MQEARRLHADADTGRRSRRDQVAGIERERGREIGDLLPDIVDELACIAVLPDLAVHHGLEAEMVGIADLVRGDDPGTDRAMRVERLAHREGRRMALPVARRHVVDDGVAEDMVLRVGFAHALRRAADHDAQLDLIVELIADPGIDRVERAGEAAGLLVEPELLGRRRLAETLRLLDMLGVVHADRQELARPFHRRQQLRLGEREGILSRLDDLGGAGEHAIAAGYQRQHGGMVGHQWRQRDDPVRLPSPHCSQPRSSAVVVTQ